MDGILPLYKPRGMTSRQCDSKVRHILKTRKVGHGGTLDPNVDGVLPICIGKATKVVDYLVGSGKVYQGEVTLGFATTTEDLDGEVIATKAVAAAPSNEVIDQTLHQFTGTITQTPPMYSAIKVNGRRLYDYARAGETVERPKRQVTITDFKRLNEPQYDEQAKTVKFKFEVSCSKGTYVRTLAVDVGVKLGYPAVMSALTRTYSGGFALADTISLEALTDLVEKQQSLTALRPLDYALRHYPAVDLTIEQWHQVQNGAFLPAEIFSMVADEASVAVRFEGSIKALYHQSQYPNLYKPEKMFSVEN
ncbi:tRNA pseudouridine(55) synthase TruB [Loigolactobacillus backii]|uniref:tRNA pseudouridine synthase B n=1 Tax=Loigolactobacillus backii TaxID=375175 RepID=A0A192H488_9LACO|nr:tRNA pseudouridine(55) synthase TruB [Loigolactobacillus backii]ANK59648.1 tRNA pseudouridine(55) synthase [Loigolactobacillus backii]ANK62786.1 tRNA pseudouridine(55) synthase [Loigolactobacillus backii]ANK64642.1 tRNA pseudouridine(55) synthase [Loigolactobacillus backii]ANK66962.1 tRNA pseudouridine(55) synthase [Loigolactobacillus backii]ANK70206.1 tRNA pseudouridine(55) synthase [Loigolactobacillus backii]